MADQTRVLLASCDCLTVDLSRLKMALVPGQEAEDISILLRDMEGCNNDLKLAARKVRQCEQSKFNLIIQPSIRHFYMETNKG